MQGEPSRVYISGIDPTHELLRCSIFLIDKSRSLTQNFCNLAAPQHSTSLEGTHMAKKGTKSSAELFDFSKIFENIQIPGFDTSAIINAQQKNIEALNNAHRAVWEGYQALAQRQAQILQSSVSEATAALQQLAAVKSPQELSVKQSELMRTAFEQALANMRELAEMVSKSNNDAFATIQQRIEQGMAELNAMVEQAKG